MVLLPLVAPSTQTASYVFSGFHLSYDITGIQSKPYAVVLSFLVSQYSLYGYDAAAHLTEETKGADRNGPLGIVGAVVVSIFLGWAYILGITFAVTNLPHLLFREIQAMHMEMFVKGNIAMIGLGRKTICL